MQQLIEFFLAHHWQVTFASPAKPGPHRLDLQALGVQEVSIALNDASFDDFIQRLQPDAVLFDRFMMEEQFGWRVAKIVPNCLRILNTEDLHSLRQARHQRVKQALKSNQTINDLAALKLTDSNTLFDTMSQAEITQREIAAIYRSDLTLMISNFEIALLQRCFQVPESLLFYLPLIYPPKERTSLPRFSQRTHFVSIGNFRHAPNWDAVLWLKQTIWPLIRTQLPEAELHIYGAYPPPKATALHNPKQGFMVKGWAEDADTVIRNAKVLLAPIRFGAGIKGKLAEAMLNGTPSITTDIGAESMTLNDQDAWPGCIANSPQSFADAAIGLYKDPVAWEDAQQLGFRIAQQRFTHQLDDSCPSQHLMPYINAIMGQLDSHRRANFIGAMLNHHHHKSTQYMAQWIEAKNRLADALS